METQKYLNTILCTVLLQMPENSKTLTDIAVVRLQGKQYKWLHPSIAREGSIIWNNLHKRCGSPSSAWSVASLPPAPPPNHPQPKLQLSLCRAPLSPTDLLQLQFYRKLNLVGTNLSSASRMTKLSAVLRMSRLLSMVCISKEKVLDEPITNGTCY